MLERRSPTLHSVFFFACRSDLPSVVYDDHVMVCEGLYLFFLDHVALLQITLKQPFGRAEEYPN